MITEINTAKSLTLIQVGFFILVLFFHRDYEESPSSFSVFLTFFTRVDPKKSEAKKNKQIEQQT